MLICDNGIYCEFDADDSSSSNAAFYVSRKGVNDENYFVLTQHTHTDDK